MTNQRAAVRPLKPAKAAAFARYQSVYVGQVLPLARREIADWTERTALIADPYWRGLALDTLTYKHFHSEGGSIFGVLPADRGYPVQPFVARTVALQTGVDFLDDLSDRGGVHDEQLVFDLHRYLFGGSRPHPTVDLPATVIDWIGRLRSAIWTGLDQEPGYPAVARWLRQTFLGYSRMQTISQTETERRVSLARRWAARHQADRLGLSWQEHQGGHGSTIPALLALALAALPPEPADAIDRLAAAYHPWLTTLHIGLDSLLDLGADRVSGDFNSLAHLPSAAKRRDRLVWLARAWAERLPELSSATFHCFVYQTLVSVYLGTREPETAAALLVAGRPAG